MEIKRVILVIALVIVLATVSLVAADEAGIITINIFNNQSSQLYTDISNSTINGRTNYTNSNAVENITLTNSTLTITVNGQNIVITSQGDNLTINTPNTTQTTNSNPNNKPLLSVAFLDAGGNEHSIISGNATHQYNFNVTVGVPTSMNFPFGRNATHEALNAALTPLAGIYNLATIPEGPGDPPTMVLSWVDSVVVDGENVFTVFSTDELSTDQIQSLTVDLYNAFSLAMSGRI